MGRKFQVLVFLIPAIIFIVGIFSYLFLFERQSTQIVENKVSTYPEFKRQSISSSKIINVSYDKVLFSSAVNSFPKSDFFSSTKEYIRGAIVPHHDLASPLIAEIFQRLSVLKDVQTIIIIGPNHRDSGAGPVITGKVSWKTGLGLTNCDLDLVNDLVKSGIAKLDENRLVDEHAINTEVPFIQNYFSGVKVVPIIIDSHRGGDEVEKLVDFLSPYLHDEKYLLLGSIDFSHYLPTDLAYQKDSETRRSILARDYKAIEQYDDDHVDSQKSLRTVMMLMDTAGAKNMQIVENKNSADMIKDSSIFSSTSYFTILFKK